MVRMIQEAMTYLDRAPTPEVRLSLLETLRLVTDGKIFVEIERARLTRMLAKIKEDEGKVAEAADVLQQLQVETLGSMDKKEKTDFILEQMRLLLAKQDFIRVLMVSKKINPRYFDKNEDEEVQVRGGAASMCKRPGTPLTHATLWEHVVLSPDRSNSSSATTA